MKLSFVLLILLSGASSAAEIIVEDNSPVGVNGALSQNIGIETLGGILTPLLEEGCRLPCETTQIFSTAEDGQDQVTISLVRGNSQFASEGVNLGRYKIGGITPAPRGVPQINVVLLAAKNQIILMANEAKQSSPISIEKVE